MVTGEIAVPPSRKPAGRSPTGRSPTEVDFGAALPRLICGRNPSCMSAVRTSMARRCPAAEGADRDPGAAISGAAISQVSALRTGWRGERRARTARQPVRYGRYSGAVRRRTQPRQDERWLTGDSTVQIPPGTYWLRRFAEVRRASNHSRRLSLLVNASETLSPAAQRCPHAAATCSTTATSTVASSGKRRHS